MFEADKFLNHLRSMDAQGQAYAPESILRIRTAHQTLMDARDKPIPKMLFSEFWHEGELCILFADTNLGKSILAVQIADSISKGQAIPGFIFQAKRQRVLYFDFEMSDKQFEKRYSADYKDHHRFDDFFLRIVINPDCSNFNDFEVALFDAIEKAILEYDARVLIIDNLTYLKTQATETAKEALPLMKLLKDLKLKHDLSILALAHTPKRNLANYITKNDLAGSKHLSNFADSIFAIGESAKDKSLRYIKQIKARATEIIYDLDNVLVCEVSKEWNFLGYEFTEYSYEKDHLKIPTDTERNEVEEAILQLKNTEPSISNAEIARRLSTNKMRVGRVLEKNGNS